MECNYAKCDCEVSYAKCCDAQCSNGICSYAECSYRMHWHTERTVKNFMYIVSLTVVRLNVVALNVVAPFVNVLWTTLTT